jgi:hypothetical protein
VCVVLRSVQPIEELLFTILIARGLLSPVSRLVQPVHEDRLDTRSWTIECFRHCIHGDCDIITRFCDMPHICKRLTSKSKCSKIHVLCKNSKTWPVKHNRARRDKMISSPSASAGTAAVSIDIIWSSMSWAHRPPVMSCIFIVCLCSLVIAGASHRSRSHSDSFDIGSASGCLVHFALRGNFLFRLIGGYSAFSLW